MRPLEFYILNSSASTCGPEGRKEISRWRKPPVEPQPRKSPRQGRWKSRPHQHPPMDPESPKEISRWRVSHRRSSPQIPVVVLHMHVIVYAANGLRRAVELLDHSAQKGRVCHAAAIIAERFFVPKNEVIMEREVSGWHGGHTLPAPRRGAGTFCA